MKKVIKILAVVLVVLAVGGYFFLQWALQPEKIRSMVKVGIEGVWNGEVSIGGASVKLIPPSIALSELKLLSPEKEELISLKSLQIVPSLGEILSGKVVISSINLLEPLVNLKTSKSGELVINNCLKAAKETKEAAGKAGSANSETPEPVKGEDTDSLVSEIKINSVNVTRLFLNIPLEGEKTPLAIGPIYSSMKLSLHPELEVIGAMNLAPLKLNIAPLGINTGEVKVNFDVKGSQTEIIIHIDESALEEPSLGTILAGPVDGSISLDKTGKIVSKDLKITIPPKGTIGIGLTVSPAPASKVVAAIDCSNIETAEILKNVLSALNLTPKGANSLTVRTFKGTIVKEKDKPVTLNKFTGKMGDKATISLSGYGKSGSDYKLSAVLNSYSLFSLLEGVLNEYEFGTPIEKLMVNQANITVTPKNITLPAVKVTMGKETSITGKVVANLAHKSGKAHFDSSSVLNVKVNGDSLFSMLKLKPDSQLTGSLGGSIKLFGELGNPSAGGTLKSPLLKYVYTGAPSVPVNNVIAKISLKDMVGKVDELTGDFFGGKLKGSAECNLKLTPFTYTWKLDTLKLEMSEMVKEIPMLKDHITGALSLSLKGTGKGAENETDSLLSKLTLDGTLKSIETKIIDSKGLIVPALGDGPIAKAVQGKLEELLTTPKLKDFDLETLTSSVHIKDGELVFNDLDSTGIVGLKSDSIAINGDTTALKGTFTMTIPKSDKELALPIKLKGSLLAPDISIDPKALKDYFVKEKLDDVTNKVEDKLNKVLGDNAGSLLKGLFD